MAIGAAAGSSSSPSSTSINDSVTVAVHDYSDPLYLHLSNSSNTALISHVLTGCENYSIWSRATSFSLGGKNKLSFVEGLIPIPNKPNLAEK